jgi:hypothetical protein
MQLSANRVVEDDRPDHIAVPPNDGVGAPELVCFIRIQRRMYTAEDDDGSSGSRLGADLVTAKRVARVNPDADHVTRANIIKVERVERFVGNLRTPMGRRRRRGEDEEPAWCDDANPE